MNHLEKAKLLLKENNYTLVLVSDKEVETDTLRGVRPLLNRYGKDYSAYSAADKVIGKGAAFLYVLLQIKEVYAHVISKPALEVFESYKIPVVYDILTPNIDNHDKTGLFPIEMATLPISSPEEALPIIRKRLEELKEEPRV